MAHKHQREHDDVGSAATTRARLGRKEYERELAKLQGELVSLQRWVVASGAKVCVVFEGRDGAGKGGVIKRISERVSPRVFRVVALPAPTERERSQMYFQRYMPHLPAGGRRPRRNAARFMVVPPPASPAPAPCRLPTQLPRLRRARCCRGGRGGTGPAQRRRPGSRGKRMRVVAAVM